MVNFDELNTYALAGKEGQFIPLICSRCKSDCGSIRLTFKGKMNLKLECLECHNILEGKDLWIEPVAKL